MSLLQIVIVKFGWICHAYCLMGNHFHLAIETPQPNLSRGMRHLNGVYTQWFNARHQRVGHLLQGRFKSSLVERRGYYRELCRYIVLNPVRAGLCAGPADWRWSSYRATAGIEKPKCGLKTEFVLERFGGTDGYRAFVASAKNGRGEHDDAFRKPDGIVGSEAFVQDCLGQRLSPSSKASLSKKLRSLEWARPKLADVLGRSGSKRRRASPDAIRKAVLVHGYAKKEIAAHLGVSPSRISQIFATNQLKAKT